MLVAGANAAEAGKASAQIAGVTKAIVAETASLAVNLAAQALAIAGKYCHILLPSTANGKNVSPRAAAKLDVAQKSTSRPKSAPTPSSA